MWRRKNTGELERRPIDPLLRVIHAAQQVSEARVGP